MNKIFFEKKRINFFEKTHFSFVYFFNFFILTKYIIYKYF